MSLRFTICDRCAGEPSLDCKPALIGDQKTIQSVGRRLVLCRCGGYVFAVMMFIAAAGLLVISVAMAMTITMMVVVAAVIVVPGADADWHRHGDDEGNHQAML